MSKLRWGNEVPADVNAARERLLDAAASCIDRFGLAKTTVEDIATAANVSRATIYRYFDNRDELMLAVVLRSLDQSSDGGLDHYFAGAETPEQFGVALVDAMVHLLDRLRHDPMLSVLLNRESGGVSATISGSSQALFSIVIDDWRPRMADAQEAGLVRADLDIDELSEWVLRCILSLLTVEGPKHHAPEDERRLLASYLATAVVAPPPAGPPPPR